jgi:hypothetical protein
MITETAEECGACHQMFATLGEVFSHECLALASSRFDGPHATRRSDNIDRPELGSGTGNRYERVSGKTNRYPGSCVKCSGRVGASGGWLVKDNSSQRGGTVWGVEHKIGECDEQTEPAPEAPKSNSISEQQEKYLRSLMDRKGLPNPDGLIKTLNEAPNPKAAASIAIDEFKALPDAPKPDRLQDGIYLVDGTVYKVYHTRHGADQQVAKQLDPATGVFEYKGKAPLRKINPEHRMTLEDAKRFGQLYGMCCSCGATLTDETSIERGVGPVCAGKFV